MLTVLNELKTALTNIGNDSVYLAFDAQPASAKGKYITVIGTKSFEYLAPVYSPYTIYFPFRTELEISVTAPEYSDISSLYTYFSTKVQPAVDNMSGLCSRLSKLTVKHDTNLKKLVLTAVFSAGGIRQTERSIE